MKKFLPLFMGGLMALLLFVAPGSPAKADSNVPDVKQVLRADCGCDGIIHLTGAEKNKIVANLVSSDEFKAVKKEAKSEGFKYLGADVIQVVQFGESGPIGVSVFFLSSEGTPEGYVWINGQFVGHNPYPGDM